MNQGAVGRRPRRRSQLRTRPLGESEKRWLMGEVRRVVQRGSCDVPARDARCAEIAHEVYATPRDSVTGWPGFSSVGFSLRLRNNATNSRSLSQRAIAFFHPQ